MGGVTESLTYFGVDDVKYYGLVKSGLTPCEAIESLLAKYKEEDESISDTNQ
jgi:hypothetical protein